MTTTATRPSAPQIDLIGRLLTERTFDLEANGFDLDALTGGRNGTASALITALFDAPRAGQPAAPAEGLYRVGDDVVRIKTSKAGNWYGQIAVKPAAGGRLSWDYLGKRVNLAGATLLTDAEAGRLLVYCVRCGAELTNEDSKAAGIGPVCATR
jgi:hypothetical protein